MRFINRTRELADLEDLWRRPGAQMVVVYGRRRTGKTTLLTRFLQEKPHLFWVADRFPAATLLGDFSRAIFGFEHPDLQPETGFTYPSWEMALRALAVLGRERRLGVVMDELPYAVESEPGLPSLLQRIWDHELKETQVFLALCGSQIGMMERELMSYRAPLYGRRTGQVLLRPMDFAALREYFPLWSTAQQVTAYAILGGVPSYWEQFDPGHSLEANIRERILRPSNLLYLEPAFLVNEELREPRNYLGILRAIGQGQRQMVDIAAASGVPRTNLSRYLETLRELRLIERRLPVTERNPETSRRGLYRLSDNYLAFYFRFVAPFREDLEQGYAERAWQTIDQQLPAFVGATAFEEICREWVWRQGMAGRLPFSPEQVGSYWDRSTQVDVVALDRRERVVLLGEARWTSRPLTVQTLDELRGKAAAVLPEPGWRYLYALFSRSGFSEALQQEAERAGVLLVSLETLVGDSAGA
ncbi:MAG: ATP-binding protein [Caldilineales bacterium]|nr:ATP-binding protein [Caldilineales bacterium]